MKGQVPAFFWGEEFSVPGEAVFLNLVMTGEARELVALADANVALTLLVMPELAEDIRGGNFRTLHPLFSVRPHGPRR